MSGASSPTPRGACCSNNSGVHAMAGMKIIPLLVAGDNAVREDVYHALHVMTHAVRVDLQSKIDQITNDLKVIRADVDKLMEEG